MPMYYLIRGNSIIAELETAIGDATALALPLIYADDAPLSLLNSQHATALANHLSLPLAGALDALGLVDLRSTMLRTIFVSGSPPASPVGGLVAYHLADVGGYALWQVDGQQEDLLALHGWAWATSPANTLGLLAVVQEFGASFYASAVRAATGMTVQQALARRDRVAAYLESLGYTDTAALRAATDEHAQMLGVVQALGYTVAQLWAAMAA